MAINSSAPGQMATISQMLFSDTFSWSNWQQPSIGLDNGCAPNRRQAIIWTNVDPIHWRIHAAQGGGVKCGDALTSLAGERASISLAASHHKIAWNFLSRWLSVKWYSPLWSFVRGLTAMLPNHLTNVTAIDNFKRQYLQGLTISHMINSPVKLVY